MKSIFIILSLIFSGFFLFGQQTSVHPQMDYHLSWDGKSSRLKVDLYYTPCTKDTTAFIFGKPEDGNQNDIFNVVVNIQGEKGDSIVIDSGRRKSVLYYG